MAAKAKCNQFRWTVRNGSVTSASETDGFIGHIDGFHFSSAFDTEIHEAILTTLWRMRHLKMAEMSYLYGASLFSDTFDKLILISTESMYKALELKLLDWIDINFFFSGVIIIISRTLLFFLFVEYFSYILSALTNFLNLYGWILIKFKMFTNTNFNFENNNNFNEANLFCNIRKYWSVHQFWGPLQQVNGSLYLSRNEVT